MSLLSTMLADCPAANHSGSISLPYCPTHCNTARFGGRCSHTYGWQVANTYDFAVLDLAGLYEVIPYKYVLAWAADSIFLPKSGRRPPAGSGCRWHGGEGSRLWFWTCFKLGSHRRPHPSTLFYGQRQAQSLPGTGVAATFGHGRVGPDLQNTQPLCWPCWNWAKSSRNCPESTANPERTRCGNSYPGI